MELVHEQLLLLFKATAYEMKSCLPRVMVYADFVCCFKMCVRVLLFLNYFTGSVIGKILVENYNFMFSKIVVVCLLRVWHYLISYCVVNMFLDFLGPLDMITHC